MATKELKIGKPIPRILPCPICGVVPDIIAQSIHHLPRFDPQAWLFEKMDSHWSLHHPAGSTCPFSAGAYKFLKQAINVWNEKCKELSA